MWKLARVQEVFERADGFPRSCKIKLQDELVTNRGLLKLPPKILAVRNVSKLQASSIDQSWTVRGQPKDCVWTKSPARIHGKREGRVVSPADLGRSGTDHRRGPLYFYGA